MKQSIMTTASRMDRMENMLVVNENSHCHTQTLLSHLSCIVGYPFCSLSYYEYGFEPTIENQGLMTFYSELFLKPHMLPQVIVVNITSIARFFRCMEFTTLLRFAKGHQHQHLFVFVVDKSALDVVRPLMKAMNRILPVKRETIASSSLGVA